MKEKLYDEGTYIRKENLIVSGTTVVEFQQNKNCVDILRKIFQEKLNVEVGKKKFQSLTDWVGSPLLRDQIDAGLWSNSVAGIQRGTYSKHALWKILRTCIWTRVLLYYDNKSHVHYAETYRNALTSSLELPLSMEKFLYGLRMRILVPMTYITVLTRLKILMFFCQRNIGLPVAHFLTRILSLMFFFSLYYKILYNI